MRNNYDREYIYIKKLYDTTRAAMCLYKDQISTMEK